MGGAKGVGWEVFWAGKTLLLLCVGVVLGAFPKWETMEAQFPIYMIAYKVF